MGRVNWPTLTLQYLRQQGSAPLERDETAAVTMNPGTIAE
jgi:hypothetical protein